ncbi:nitrogenase iron-molybdenum cofactor biosynthesis protein NifN [Geoalkalibacter halelectricus]|uniref:Nitrogenase iron-molybdenum cofactor biosynthesis protein NifN n=1 Tax=Geoalkalibacter halelectricus TaxID=2847045 RepID=A0ABY5ZR97_9BACT|nr:nitrogenase iron-molybdenum cofactor biosynthesis protein NifN [Geoalkalibacter halelectricus]MDO3380091.1 nitrogenase iron-molybdenum cofactor biosynthesis protein NifN [Geoalkalibacter halelectricus]UWZ80390.1 nitrogenase iron-molybdenum cofactor biosynthesis protein NifN [Geoalkalibacter halelectricus]
MGEVSRKPGKPLQVNPIKLSQPMGAALAFLGVNQCMPLMHGALGCASFTKVFLTRHFSEPIAIQTTAVTDITAILDGGDYNIVESVKNITAKVAPKLIGLHTTGLTETKGDDIRGVAAKIDFPLVHVNTPDYEGGLESGWALATRALIRQLVRPTDQVQPDKLVLLPHVGLQPIEVEKIKEFIALFGFEALALPDLSTSLDGHLGHKQGALSGGGIEVDDIENLADAALVISIGASMRDCAQALREKNPAMSVHHFDHLHGLEVSDALVELLMQKMPATEIHPGVKRWRMRLQDAMLDCHFALGQTRFAVVGEPDQVAGLCQALTEAGGRVTLALTTVDAPQLAPIKATRVLVGDLEDAERLHEDYDLIIGNFHCEALALRYHKGLVLRGFPNWEQVGNQLKNDLLYEGGAYFLCEVANAADHQRRHEAKG